MEFVKAFNAQTANDMGTTIPVVITVYEDRSFTFVTKTPPAAVLIRQAIGIEKGSGEPNRTKVGTITDDAGARDRREEARRPQRARRRPGGEDHRRHRALDGRGGAWRNGPRQDLQGRAREGRPRRASTRPPRPSSSSRSSSARSSTSPSRSTSARASTSATPTSSCAARSRCRTASARTSRSPSSPAATRRARPRRPAPTSWAPRTSPTASRTRASPTSTSRSRRRT